LVKAAALLEILTSFLAFALLLLIAPLAARHIVRQPWTQSLFVLYGLVLLTNLAYETATGVLQSTRRFNDLSKVNLAQSLITAGWILWAYLRQGDIEDVLLAYLMGKSIAGLALYGLAWRKLDQELGAGWWRIPLSQLPPRRELFSFAMNTNLQGTINLVVRDSEALLVTWLRNPVEAGYYKIAQGVINLVMLPIEPFIATTYAEITRTVSQRLYKLTRRLLKRVSLIAAGWTLAAGGGLALLGWWLIPFLYGQEYAPAYLAALALLVGYGFANILNWNRPLLLALGRPGYPLAVSALAGAGKTVLTVLITPIGGYVAEASILSAYLVTSVSVIVWRGMRELRQRGAQEPSTVALEEEQP
jgi:O-antigen/teichoic acid export membrane protein